MAFTASQYLFKASTLVATTTATVGGYIVPAATRGQVIAVTVANTATSNAINFVDVEIFDGTNAYNVSGNKTQIFPGGSIVIMGIEKHTLPTGGGIYVTPYATTGIDVCASIIEVT